jgi:hypothetical protein
MFGNNIWTCGEYEITRYGSAYWGFTGYFLTFKGETIAQGEKLNDAVKAAKAHANG